MGVPTVGYYEVGAGLGINPQAQLIDAVGYQARQLTDLTDFKGLDILYVWNPSQYGYASDWTNAATAVNAYMAGGGILVFHDNFAGGLFTQELTAHAREVNFIDHDGILANGPGGALTDASLDGYQDSSHGYLDLAAHQDDDIAALMTRDDPTHAVTILEAQGKGWLYDSTIPISVFAGDASDPNMTAYAENAIAYAGMLHALTYAEVDASTHRFLGRPSGDNVLGTDGADKIQGAGGDDFIRGGAGSDKIVGGLGADTAWGDAGTDQIKGGDGNDQLWGDAGRDKLGGGGGGDLLFGGSDNDKLSGGDGDDLLMGGSGADHIDGGEGDDTMLGGQGADTFTGGAGANVYLLGAWDQDAAVPTDVVLDFHHGVDKVDLSNLGDDFTFGSHHAHTIALSSDGAGGTLVRVDVDGDGSADIVLDLHPAAGSAAADSSDFIL